MINSSWGTSKTLSIFAIAVIVVLLAGSLYASLVPDSEAQAVRAEPTATPTPASVVLLSERCNRVERIVDEQAGAVCWVEVNCQGGGISCLPMKELE